VLRRIIEGLLNMLGHVKRVIRRQYALKVMKRHEISFQQQILCRRRLLINVKTKNGKVGRIEN